MSTANAEGEPELVLDHHGAITVVRLNRPDAANALTPSLMEALGAAIIEAESDPTVRVVVLTGTGDRAFCAGLDLRAFAAGDSAPRDGERSEAFVRLLHGRTRVPVVGAANGTAVAGGLELLLGCDLVVLAEGSELGLPEVKRGLFAAGGGTLIGTRVPLSIALELILTGDPIDAGRARELGLANAVVPSEEVMELAMDFANRIAANGPLGVQASKELVRLATNDAAGAAARLRELQAEVFASDDAREGALAYIEKRAPVWRGR